MAEKKPLRFLIVNNYSRFASKDVFDGFMAAVRQDLNHHIMAYPVDVMQAWFSGDMVEHHITSTAVATRNEFTHAIFIGSAFLKDWVPNTIRKCGVKVAYWSLEDPHALDQNSRFMDLSDYYFTNERAVARQFEKADYLPTAGAHTVCVPPQVSLSELHLEDREILENDVVFCGNVYPNRRKILEPLLPHFQNHAIRFGIMGVFGLMGDDEKKSPLRNHIRGNFEGVVDHRWVVMAYGYSKFVINIERDPHWEYNEKFSTNRKYGVIGESLNPRAYEIALTGGGLQLIDESRKEIFEKGILEPGKHCVTYKGPEDMVEKILYYREHEAERRKIVRDARSHALANHTYASRAKRMIDIINWKEGRREGIAKDVLAKIFSGQKVTAKGPAI